MARPLRIERAGGWYHVTARGNERRDIYRDDRDRRHFLELMEEMVAIFRVRVHAYVLMNNHYHLMVELTEANLSRTFQWLNVSYSVWFNRRHGRSGHLFQGRFKSVAVSRDAWGLELSRYVHLNPVRVRGLGMGKEERGQSRQGVRGRPSPEMVRRRLEVLRGYRWSSYRAYIGLEQEPEWLECKTIRRMGGGGEAKAQRRLYREYVETAVREGLKQTPWESPMDQVVLGPREFVEELKRGISRKAGERQRLDGMVEARPKWERVVACVEEVKGEKWSEFRDRHGDGGREMAMHLARRVGGMTVPQMAKQAGMSSNGAATMAVRRFERRLVDDAKLRSQVDRVVKMLLVMS